ncbi:amino acid ABC transporter permease [Hydrogenophaga crassostreae]|uniref:Amino acid ABC transporter permease n=1 Tax=Hydrogenophaga crassostreae TaxID=1763535 RepID=A0A162P2K2_9BURK|nr:ABC transporter permease subunit [Hydrogenophaga crassostreae]AOW12609.1 amino acid ABC transporter permease [Hydrogenophaga crassostreae]OAD40480.1 amino acid ABC transporter permease [Hydrogenophaga crassostreae]
MIEARPVPKKKSRSISWNSREGRSVIYQVVAIASIAGFLWLLVTNTLENMRRRGIQSGYDFMSQPFGFDVSETLIPYDVMSTYWTAFGIGLANTLKVAIIGIVLATLLGTLLGIGRFSTNFLVRKICYVYVEIFRNIPVYLQLLIWYIIFTETLPAFDDAWEIGNTFLSKGGFAFPWPVWKLGQSLALIGVLLGLAGSYFYARSAQRHFDKTGQRRPVLPVTLAIIIGLAVLGWLAGGAPSEWSLPEKGIFQVEGGTKFSPEFLSLLVGLVLYTASFIAEIVRSGIASVSLGQHEAAASLGLTKSMAMRLVALPQALRVIIPPLTSQYLNLTKNSSLAVAIGYPDLVSIANTSLNQTGRAIEALSIVMAVYLTLSLITALLMNWFNASSAIQER